MLTRYRQCFIIWLFKRKCLKNTQPKGGRHMRKYLFELRMNKGFSQRKVARESGISYQHYSKIENGERGNKVSFLVVGRIAKVLEVPLEKMFELEEAYQDSIEFNSESH